MTRKPYTTVSNTGSISDDATGQNMCNNGQSGCKVTSSGKLINGHSEYISNPCVSKTVTSTPGSSHETKVNITKNLNAQNKLKSLSKYDDWNETKQKKCEN